MSKEWRQEMSRNKRVNASMGGKDQGATRQGQPRGPGGKQQTETRGGDGAPSPAGWRGTPEDQARAIINNIVNLPPGGGAYSGQSPATRPQ